MHESQGDAVFSDLIAGLRQIEPARRGLASDRRRQPARHRHLVGASVLCVLVIAGTAVGIRTGTIPFGSWTTDDGNTYVDTSGDGVPDSVHAGPTSGGRLTCSLVGLTASEAGGVLEDLHLRPEWHIGLVRASDPFVTVDGGVVSQPPGNALVSDFRELDGIVRVTADVGRHAPNAAPIRQPGACRTPAG